MRKRSKLGARSVEGRAWFPPYLFYAGLVLLSLALPAILTLRSTLKPLVHDGLADGDAGVPASPVDMIKPDMTRRTAFSEAPLPKTGPVSPSLWQGIAEGIPSAPRSLHDVHLVFSTDCSPYQNYQSLILFHSAEVAEQQGRVTRVASGCTDEEQEELQALMDKQPERFGVHFTPDYSLDEATGRRYMFYNKPNGMAHFLRHVDPPITAAVVALLDPDMVIMSAITPYVGNPDAMLWHHPEFADGPEWVVEGKPVGQFYGLGGYWASWPDLEEITEHLGPETPARHVPPGEASVMYPVGPPYLMHPHDWARIVDVWVGLAPKTFGGHPGILAEMYAFCLAAAHLRLRHRVAYALMVSDSNMATREGWPLVEVLGTDVCDPSAVANHRESLPPVVHYCQLYRVGTYMFGKRHKSHHAFFSCDSDSLELPPPNYLATPMGSLRVHPKHQSAKTDKVMSEEHVDIKTGIRQGYAMCAVLRAMNIAQVSYKNRYCRPEEVSAGVRRFTDLTVAQVAMDKFG